MAAFSPFIYCPFYAVAIYAFICEKEWIRIPGTGNCNLRFYYTLCAPTSWPSLPLSFI